MNEGWGGGKGKPGWKGSTKGAHSVRVWNGKKKKKKKKRIKNSD